VVVDYLRDASFQAVKNVMLLCPANNLVLADPFPEGRNRSFFMLHLRHWGQRLSYIEAYPDRLVDLFHDRGAYVSKTFLKTLFVDSEKLSQIDHRPLL